MKLPWKQEEVRETDYTDAVVQAILANAQGEVTQGLAAAVEVCAGWWQRAFASAEIQPGGVVSDLITPHLGTIGRAMVVTGEIVFEISTGDLLLPGADSSVNRDRDGRPRPRQLDLQTHLTGAGSGPKPRCPG